MCSWWWSPSWLIHQYKNMPQKFSMSEKAISFIYHPRCFVSISLSQCTGHSIWYTCKTYLLQRERERKLRFLENEIRIVVVCWKMDYCTNQIGIVDCPTTSRFMRDFTINQWFLVHKLILKYCLRINQDFFK